MLYIIFYLLFIIYLIIDFDFIFIILCVYLTFMFILVLLFVGLVFFPVAAVVFELFVGICWGCLLFVKSAFELPANPRPHANFRKKIKIEVLQPWDHTEQMAFDL